MFNQSTRLIALSLIGSAAIASSAWAQSKLTANAAFPRSHPMFVGTLGPWVANVEKATNGRVKVEIPTASLAPFRRQWDMVSRGIADIAINPNAFQRERLHFTQVVTLPFLTTNAEANSVSLWRAQKKFFDKHNEHKGMKLLGMFVHSGYSVQNGLKPITTIADLQGIKIRTGAGASQKIFKAIGGSPVSVPGTKLFEYVSKGTVDGILATTGSIQTYKIGRYIKYVTDFPGTLGSGSFSLVMRQKSWDGLPATDRAAIEKISYETVSRAGGKGWDDQDKKGVADINQYNIRRNVAPASLVNAIKSKVQFLEDDWIAKAKKKGLADPKAALAYYRDEGKRLAGK